MAKLYETITAENWCQHALSRPGVVWSPWPKVVKRYCLLGHALRRYPASGRYEIEGAVSLDLHLAVATLYPDRSVGDSGAGNVMLFNNPPDTTAEDIIRVCKFADI